MLYVSVIEPNIFLKLKEKYKQPERMQRYHYSYGLHCAHCCIFF